MFMADMYYRLLGAQKAGIVAGDKIIAIDNKKVESWDDVQQLVQANQLNGKVSISVLRDEAPLTFLVSIHQKQIDDFLGKKRNVGLIGIMASDETKITSHGVFEAVAIAGERTWDLTVLTYRAIWSMLVGRISFRESVTGPLGMFYITSKVASLGITAVIHFLATISISLCIFNLLPLPALDGGHLVLLFIEKIRGKALNPKIERSISQVGFTLLITLALVVTYNDILRIFGEKIAKFFIKN
jgi:regulator of sigma E protease